MVRRIVLYVVLCLTAFPAHAGLVDDIQKEVFDESGTKIKADYRQCANDSDCTALLSLCRWRAVNKASEGKVGEIVNQATLECKWPKPPATPPFVRCIDRLCDIRSDGKYY